MSTDVSPGRPHMASDAAVDALRRWASRPGRWVVLDFNGTLSDDEPILERIFRELFDEQLGWVMTSEEYQEHLLGHSDREIVEIAVERHGGDEALVTELLAERRARYKDIVAQHSPITRDAVEFVRSLDTASVPVAIVTGAQHEDVFAVLDHSDVGDWISLVVSEEDVRHGKPHPEGFLSAAAQLGLDPADALVFEDSVPGIMAAQAARMTCVAVLGRTPNPRVLELTDVRVAALTPALLDCSEL